MIYIIIDYIYMYKYMNVYDATKSNLCTAEAEQNYPGTMCLYVILLMIINVRHDDAQGGMLKSGLKLLIQNETKTKLVDLVIINCMIVSTKI